MHDDERTRLDALFLLERGIDACSICGGAHRPTQCPEVAALLNADVVSAGRAIFKHVHTQWPRFLRAYEGWDDDMRYCVAREYAAYRGWTTAQALELWALALAGPQLPSSLRQPSAVPDGAAALATR